VLVERGHRHRGFTTWEFEAVVDGTEQEAERLFPRGHHDTQTHRRFTSITPVSPAALTSQKG
jgi:hypothetical protein